MVGPTDIHPSPTPRFKTFKVFMAENCTVTVQHLLTPSDCFSVTDHEWISEQIHDDGHSEEAWNIPLGVEDVLKDLESDVGEGVKTCKVRVMSPTFGQKICPPLRV